jgi:hypothetical protein
MNLLALKISPYSDHSVYLQDGNWAYIIIANDGSTLCTSIRAERGDPMDVYNGRLIIDPEPDMVCDL